VPAIVLTAQALTESTVDQLNQGVAAVLAKGVFNTAEMLSLVEKALARNSLLGTESQRTVRKAMAYIHENFSQPLSRQIIADHIGLSQRHLTRCFQDELGISPMAYLNRYRIKQAKSLLADSRLNVTEVALAVGFNDSSYFGRVFHREVGLTPGAYQRAPK
jgi:transcriptional regulator GlxA family with amidase domain